MNLDLALRDLEARIVYPAEPDLAAAVVEQYTAPPAPWWYRPRLVAAVAAVAIVVLVVGLIPAARDQVASWLGIRGVTIETVPPPTALEPATITSPTDAAPSTTVAAPPLAGLPDTPVPSGLGEGLVLGHEIVSLFAEQFSGFAPLYPELGQPDREFVDAGGRVWMLYSTARTGFPETVVPGVGMIVTEFVGESPGIIKQVVTDDVELFGFGDGLFGLWLPGPHELILPDADGSAVAGRSAGNTLLWEQGDLTMRIETVLTRDEAVAIAETFE